MLQTNLKLFYKLLFIISKKKIKLHDIIYDINETERVTCLKTLSI